MRVVRFLIFLALYGAFIWASTVWLKSLIGRIEKNQTFWTSQFVAVSNIFALFVFPVPFTGYLNLPDAAAYLGVSEFALLITLAAGAALGSGKARWGARWLWASQQFAVRNKRLITALWIVSIATFLAYPFVIGGFYIVTSGKDLYLRILQCTLCLVFIPSFIVTVPPAVGGLASENLDPATRMRVFCNQLGGLIPNVLILGLIFWSFGISGAGVKLPFGGTSVVFSPMLMLVFVVIFILPILGGYLVGGQNAKLQRLALINVRKDWVTKLADAMDTPNGAKYVPKLSLLKQRIIQEINDYISADPFVGYGLQVAPAATGPVEIAFLAARDVDPRFSHVDSINEICQLVDEVVDDLNSRLTPAEVERAAEKWAAHLYRRDEALNGELEDSQKTKTAAVLLGTIVLAPIVTGILGELSKWLWQSFSSL